MEDRQSKHKGELNFMAALDDEIAALTAQVKNATTVEASAKALIDGFQAQLKAATDAAAAAGASPEQLASFTTLGSSLDSASSDLAASVAANTPAAPTA